MAANSEITAKLGIDTKSIPRDLEEANGFFKKFSRENAEEGGRAGESYSKKLTEKLSEKLGGSREIAHALATAFGLNIEKISENIAAAIVGGSKEGFQEMEKLADETFAAIKRRQNVGKGAGDLASDAAKELKAKVNELNALNNKRNVDASPFEGEEVSVGQNSEEDRIKAAELTKEIAVLEAEISEHKYEQTNQDKEQDRQQDEINAKQEGYFATQERIKKLNEEISTLTAKQDLDAANGKDVHKVRKELLEKEKDLAEAKAKIDESTKLIEEAVAESQKAEIERQKKLNEEKTKEYNLTKDIAQLRNKEQDKNKLTISELAHLKGKQGGLDLSTNISTSFGEEDNSGLTDQQREDKAKARRVIELQNKAEQARQGGDSEGAGQLNQQVAALQSELVKGGSVKSTEAPDDAIVAEISHSNDLLEKVQKSIKELSDKHFANE